MHNQLEAALCDDDSSNTPEGTTTSNVKISRIFKDNLKHDKCFEYDQIRKRKRKSRA